MKNIKLDTNSAKKRGDAGLNRAIAGAESIHPNWAEVAYQFFKKWLSRKPSGYRFLMEDVRLRIQISKAVPEPKSHRAYGGAPRRAENEKLIRRKGIRATKSTTAHGCYSTEWEKI